MNGYSVADDPMARSNHNRRKQLIVNPRMQGRMVMGMAALPAVAIAGIAVFTGVYCSHVMEEALQLDSELPDLMPLIWLVISFEVFSAGILLVSSLKISHTIAGPAYRIQKSLERIRSGDISFRVKLRKGDHLTEVRDELNRLLDWLQEHPPTGIEPSAKAAATTTSVEPAATDALDPVPTSPAH